MSSAEDQQKADAAPEQPPHGAMSFGEFVRSKSDDVAMSMLKTIINQLLENEDQTAKIRENIYGDITRGEISAPDGLLNLLDNDRNASFQRVGFLTGYATAIGLQSDVLTTIQASFAGRQTNVPVFVRAAGTSGENAREHTDMTEANGADEKVESNILNGRGNNLETNGLEGVNDSVAADGDGAGMSGGVSVVNITGI